MSLSIETELRRALADLTERRDSAIKEVLDTVARALGEAVEIGRELGRAETVLASVAHAGAPAPTLIVAPNAVAAQSELPAQSNAATAPPVKRPRDGTAASAMLVELETAGQAGLSVADLNQKMEKSGFKSDAVDKAKAKLRREHFAANSTKLRRWWATSARPPA